MSAPPAPLPDFADAACLLRENARAAPAQPALACGAETLDYAALDALVDAVAVALQHGGLGPGEAVAVCAARSMA